MDVERPCGSVASEDHEIIRRVSIVYSYQFQPINLSLRTHVHTSFYNQFKDKTLKNPPFNTVHASCGMEIRAPGPRPGPARVRQPAMPSARRFPVRTRQGIGFLNF